MPFYDFECTAGHIQELLLKMDEVDDVKVTCTECNEEMKRSYKMSAKSVIMDKDLMLARDYSGKKWN